MVHYLHLERKSTVANELVVPLPKPKTKPNWKFNFIPKWVRKWIPNWANNVLLYCYVWKLVLVSLIKQKMQKRQFWRLVWAHLSIASFYSINMSVGYLLHAIIFVTYLIVPESLSPI